MRHTLPAIVILLFLFLALPSVPLNLTEPALEETASAGRPQAKPTTAAYTPHAPINITTNEDFRAQEWPGEGTEKNPFVIEGLNITTSGVCISVADTKAVFEIRNCFLTASTFAGSAAVLFENVISGSVIGCIIDKHGVGVLFTNSEYCSLSDNTATVYGDGVRCFWLNSTSRVTLFNNTAHANGNPLYPDWRQYGFFLDSSPDCVLTGNVVYGLALCPFNSGFFLASSDGCTLSDNAAYGSGNFGFEVYGARFCTLSNNTATGRLGYNLAASAECTVIDNTATGCLTGFELDSSNACTLRNNSASGCGTGFYVHNSVDCTLTNNRASSAIEHGFFVYNSYGIMLSGGNSSGNSKAGFYLDSAISCAVTNSTATGNSITGFYGGFHLLNCYNCTLTDSTTIDNSQYGVFLLHASVCALANNTAANNVYGFYLQFSAACHLTNNTASANAHSGFVLEDSYECTLTENTAAGNYYGIFVSGSSAQNTLFLNWIGPNNQNALCFSSGTTWDDGTSRGNHWSDYTGTGVYPVPGGTDTVDRFPFGMEPHIDHPADVQYEEGSSGHSITWHPSSPHPFSYELYIDTGSGVLYGTGPWDGSVFTVSVSGLGIGSYSYRLVVYDAAGNSTSDTATVTVVDSTAPTVNTPPDRVYESGTTGHKIVWTPHDLHLASYDITCDQMALSGVWDGTNLTVSADGLALGAHNFTLVVHDTSNNSATDTVIITVVDNTAPTIDRPADLSYVHGTTGHMMTWSPIDLHPASYVILQDGSGVGSGTWNGSAIIISVDGLDLGSYNFTLIVYDTSSHSITDQVMVTVNPPNTTTTTTMTTTTSTATTTTSTTTPADTGSPLSGQMVMVVVAAGAGILVLLVAFYLRRR